MAAPAQPVDWPRLIVDLSGAGLSLRLVEHAMDVPTSTIQGWKAGAQPKHSAGERLISLWCSKTGQSREVVPVTR